MDEERASRLALACVVEPGDPAAVRLLTSFTATEVWRKVRAGLGPSSWASRARSFSEREVRLLMERSGLWFIVPGDDEWPRSLADLDSLEPVNAMQGQPIGLWVRGRGSLAAIASRSVAIVGARASTPYGDRVAADLAAGLTEAGWAVVSGGAYGVDAAAHRGALAGGGQTICVQGGGLDELYPRGNSTLLERVVESGLLVSEAPPGQNPTRRRFLSRNRLIAAMSQGTVIVEAAARSGARNTVSWASSCLRPVMAVPGPVSSATSYGPHRLIRDGEATLVTGLADILEVVSPAGENLVNEPDARPTLFDSLTEPQRLVYEAIPARGGRSAGEVAVRAGVGIQRVLGSLAELELAGMVQRRSDGSWGLGERRDRPLLASEIAKLGTPPNLP